MKSRNSKDAEILKDTASRVVNVTDVFQVNPGF